MTPKRPCQISTPQGGGGVPPPPYSECVTPEVGGGVAPPSILHAMSPRSVDMNGPAYFESEVLLGAQVQMIVQNFQTEMQQFEARQKNFELRQLQNEQKMLQKIDDAAAESVRKTEIGQALLQKNMQEFCGHLFEKVAGEGAKDGALNATLVDAHMKAHVEKIEKMLRRKFCK